MRVKPAEILHLDGHEVGITRPEKVFFPGEGITKGDVVRYYQRISPWMLPHLAGRALAIERFPDGIGKAGFFQKAAAGSDGVRSRSSRRKCRRADSGGASAEGNP